MKPSPIKEVTQLLRAWRQGNDDAKEQLYQAVYNELHRMAHRYMSRENSGQTLQTTALVNEAYLKLADARMLDWQDRVHFFAVSANIMRRILVDRARSKQAVVHGGEFKQVAIEDVIEIPEAPKVDFLALDLALDKLAQEDERKSRIVELRFFGGLTNQEIAQVLNVSEDTVMRDWRYAKAKLRRELSGENGHDPADNRNSTND